MRVDDKTYTNQGNEPLLRRIREHLPAAAECLDVGCGAGDNARCLTRLGWAVDGVTISAAEAQLAARFCRRIWIHNLETGLPSEGRASYRLIVASHVLEHLCFPSNLLRHCHDSLEPTGFFVVALPNIMWWKQRIQLMLGRFEYAPHGIMDNTHFRWYTFASAHNLLADHGFEVVQADAVGHAPIGRSRKWLPPRVADLLDRLFQRASPGLAANQMIFVAKKSAN